MGYRRLTQAEIEALRAEMREAGAWCKAELKRRREAASSGSDPCPPAPSGASTGTAPESAESVPASAADSPAASPRPS